MVFEPLRLGTTNGWRSVIPSTSGWPGAAPQIGGVGKWCQGVAGGMSAVPVPQKSPGSHTPLTFLPDAVVCQRELIFFLLLLDPSRLGCEYVYFIHFIYCDFFGGGS